MTTYFYALAGGILLGLSSLLMLILNGRILGVSGIVGRLIGGQSVPSNALFVLGLVIAPYLYYAGFGTLPQVTVSAPWPIVGISGLLVGVGTRMGSGCTSGHGIMGMARLSKRSIAATSIFLMTGIIAATLPELFK
jgi:uncharacterized membrane protein YedE/YeeE